MTIGSHNSMTYLKPRTWWMRLLGIMARCQSISLYAQFHDHNVRHFDLRIRFRDGRPIFAHGLCEYEGLTPDEAISMLDFWAEMQREHTYIIVTLEWQSHYHLAEQIRMFNDWFTSTLAKSKSKYLHIGGGGCKRDWSKVVDAETDNYPHTSVTKCASMTGSVLDDWLPWLYAATHNRYHRRHTKTDLLILDFVQY